MVSDFVKNKLQHVFQFFFDVNGSGTIDQKDFEVVAEKVSKLKGWKAGDSKFKETQELLLKIWNGLQSGADADKDGQVTQDEWNLMWVEYAKNPAVAPEWQNLYCKFIFQLEDASNDGAIDSEEFSSVYASFGLNKDESKVAFKQMAQGKDSVSWPDFQVLWKQYFTSEDPNVPGTFIFGKTKF